MVIAVIGLGFVGLTTALGLSAKGFKVIGFDSDATRVRQIRAGKLPFHEPYLKKALSHQKDKRFFIAQGLKEAVKNSKIIFFCVGTPSKDDGAVDLSHVLHALRETARYLDKKAFQVLVLKSSVPPSTTADVVKPLLERLGFEVGKNVGLACNPEFLREGYAWRDFLCPDRIVIGSSDRLSAAGLQQVYQGFKARKFYVSFHTAEFIKYFSNAFLSNLISFSNEMEMAADAIGSIDLKTAFRILHLDRRWLGNPAKMTNYLYPGCGFGGYCLPKDTRAFHHALLKKGYPSVMIKGSLAVNDKIKRHVCSKIEKNTRKNEWIGVLGLSFKPNSDDVRESPAKDIIELLIERGFKRIIGYDPLAVQSFKLAYHLPIQYENSLVKVMKKADCLVILTAWDEFRKIGTSSKKVFGNKRIMDFRYMTNVSAPHEK